ncbi:MAG TPA: AsnC family protein [Acidiphilium sp.]
MPECRVWTKTADDTICRMRALGATWATIGAELGLSRNTIIARGRRIGAVGGPERLQRPPRPPEDDPNRPPLPAGHPITWGILTRGTILEGSPFVPLSSPRQERHR